MLAKVRGGGVGKKDIMGGWPYKMGDNHIEVLSIERGFKNSAHQGIPGGVMGDNLSARK